MFSKTLDKHKQTVFSVSIIVAHNIFECYILGFYYNEFKQITPKVYLCF